MSQWNDPRFIITLVLVGIFACAYWQNPGDEAMKGAAIAAFAAAYGFWLGNKQNEVATENTGKAFDAIKATAQSVPLGGGPQPVIVTNTDDEPVPTTQEK